MTPSNPTRRRAAARMTSAIAAIGLAAAPAAAAHPGRHAVTPVRAASHAAARPAPARRRAAAVAGSTTVDYIVPTRDAELFLEVVHPTDAAGNIIPAPVILTYTPYALLGRNGDAAHWTAKGYARATADVIGTGNSGGCYDYGGNREKRTAYDLIEWIAGRAWTNGKIGMLGGSYEGTTQYAAAVMHPPHLVTIVPEAAIDRWYDYAYSGGIRYTDSNEQFGNEGAGAAGDEGVDTPLAFDFGFAVAPPTDNSDADFSQRLASRIRPCDALAHTSQAYNDQPDYGGFWQERDYLRDMPDVHIPVLVAHNWGDWNVKQVDGWQVINALTHSPESRAIFGDRWHGHGTPQNTAGFSYSGAVDNWMDHYLKGAENGMPARLPRIETRSSDETTGLGYTPAPDTHPLKLTLSHDSTGFTLNPADGPAPAGSPAASYLWTQANTESAAGTQPFATGGGYVGFASAPLTHDLRIFGEPVLHFWSSVNQQWVTTAVSLLDFDPAHYQGSGAQTAATSKNAVVALTRGWLDSRYRDGLESAELVTPGQPFDQDLALKPTDYTVRAGHRLVLLMSTETLEWAKSKAPQLPGTDPSVTVAYGQGQSYLTLPAATGSANPF